MPLVVMQRFATQVPFPRPSFAAHGFPRAAPPAGASAASPEQALPRDISSRFGRRVRELRRARGMTQCQVAETFGIDRTFLSDVERGRKSVGLPTMEVFALGFGVSLSDMLRGL